MANHNSKETEVLFLDDYVATLKRRKWEFLVPALLVFLVSISVTHFLPDVYESTGTILIEQQEIPVDLVRSTVTSYADQRVQIIRQRVMTSQNLSEIIERHDLYKNMRSDLGMSNVVEKMRNDIDIAMISADVVDPRTGSSGNATIAFSIAYKSESPSVAQRVANDIVSLFLNENIKERQRSAQAATSFLLQESEKLSQQVSSLEEKLAKFKEQHGDSIPEMKAVNLQLIQRTDDSMRQVEQEISALEANQVYLEAELRKLNPYTSIYSEKGERVLSPSDRLKALEIEDLRVRSRYSENHPDRIAIQRELSILRQEVGRQSSEDLKRLLAEQRNQLASLLIRFSEEHPSVQALRGQINATENQIKHGRENSQKKAATSTVSDADDPAYIQLQTQLIGNQSKLDALQNTRAQLKNDLSDLEKRIENAPKVEREYLLITRDYESAVEKYNQVRSKNLEASLAESLETERKSERFTLIEPPLIPLSPSSPNRRALLLVGFVLALGSGGAVLAAREALSDGIYSIRAVKTITGEVPLTIIPKMTTPADRTRKHRLIILVGLLVFVTFIGGLLVIHILIKPLDVAWFLILNSLKL